MARALGRVADLGMAISAVAVVVTFLGLAGTLRSGGFIRVDTYRSRARGRGRAALDLSIYAPAAAYTAVLNRYLWHFALDSYRFKSTSIYFTQTPLWIPHSLMALGGSLLLLEVLAGACLVASGAGAHAEGGASTKL